MRYRELLAMDGMIYDDSDPTGRTLATCAREEDAREIVSERNGLIARIGKMERRLLEIEGITVRDGLLWRKGEIVPVREADNVARDLGFVYAEDLVRHLQS
jgi:hypothetical protein